MSKAQGLLRKGAAGMSKEATVVCFDWNGTLLADTLHCLRATNTVLKHLGKQPVSIDHYRRHCVVPIANMYRVFGCGEKELQERKEEIHEIWNGVYDKHTRTARLRRGARVMLQILRELDHTAIILSNHTVENIAGHTKRLGIHGHFDRILANDAMGQAFLNKGKGEKLRPYLAGGTAKGLVVGDTVEEIEIAHAHNMLAVAITDGVCSTQRLRDAKPDFLIGSLTEIPAIAERVFSRSRKGA
jgi:phosphoglycolate phosphatase-like HAD superfamily hydrolase